MVSVGGTQSNGCNSHRGAEDATAEVQVREGSGEGEEEAGYALVVDLQALRDVQSLQELALVTWIKRTEWVGITYGTGIRNKDMEQLTPVFI